MGGAEADGLGGDAERILPQDERWITAVCCADDWAIAQGSMASGPVSSLIRCHYDTASWSVARVALFFCEVQNS